MCQICAKAKPNLRAREPLELIKDPPVKSGQTVALDVATLPWSEEGYRYFLLIVDTFSKLIEIIPMRDQTAESIKGAFLAGWVYRHGVPNVLLSDQGKNVVGEVLHALCKELGICKKHSSAYYPEGNGTAERSIGKVKQIMRCLLADRNLPKTHWPVLLNEISFISNSLPNASTTMSPQELTYGRTLRSPLEAQIDNMQGAEEGEIPHYSRLGKLVRRREQLEAIAREENEKSRIRAKKFYDRKSHSRSTTTGDWVMIRREARKDALDLHFEGPFEVIQRKGPNVKVRSSRVRDGKLVHLNRCRPWGNREISIPYHEAGDKRGEMAPETDEEDLGSDESDSPVLLNPKMNQLDPESDFEGSKRSSGTIAEEGGGLRRSTRSRNRPDWFGYPDSD